jgi:hypothetical protein
VPNTCPSLAAQDFADSALGDLVLSDQALGRDAYEAHMTLESFGLLDVEIDEDRHYDDASRVTD